MTGIGGSVGAGNVPGIVGQLADVVAGENDGLQGGVEFGLVAGNELGRGGRGKDRVGFGQGVAVLTWRPLRPGRTICPGSPRRPGGSGFALSTFRPLLTLNSRFSLSTFNSASPWAPAGPCGPTGTVSIRSFRPVSWVRSSAAEISEPLAGFVGSNAISF